jgi:hypothetical protein
VPVVYVNDQKFKAALEMLKVSRKEKTEKAESKFRTV